MTTLPSFDLPALVEPTLEEHRTASAEWLATIGPCLYENWPAALKRMSFPTRCVRLSHEDQDEILLRFDHQSTAHSDILMARIDAEISGAVFPRLSSRSAKDAWCDTFKCHTAAGILEQFASSERILDDLVQYQYAATDCYLLLREWQDIPKHEEWRCFIRNRRIIGISQYHYQDDFGPIYGDGADCHRRIVGFLTDVVIPVLHIDPVVVDIWLAADPKVIEINPYGRSDPCLFTYSGLAGGGGRDFAIFEGTAAGALPGDGLAGDDDAS